MNIIKYAPHDVLYCITETRLFKYIENFTTEKGNFF